MAIQAKWRCHPGSVGIKPWYYSWQTSLSLSAVPYTLLQGWTESGVGVLGFPSKKNNKSGKVCKSYSMVATQPNNHSASRVKKNPETPQGKNKSRRYKCRGVNSPATVILSFEKCLNLWRSSPPVMLLRVQNILSSNEDLQEVKGGALHCHVAKRVNANKRLSSNRQRR